MPTDPKDIAETLRQANNVLINFNTVLVTAERMGASFKGVDVTAALKEAPALLGALKDLVASMKCP